MYMLKNTFCLEISMDEGYAKETAYPLNSLSTVSLFFVDNC